MTDIIIASSLSATLGLVIGFGLGLLKAHDLVARAAEQWDEVLKKHRKVRTDIDEARAIRADIYEQYEAFRTMLLSLGIEPDGITDEDAERLRQRYGGE